MGLFKKRADPAELERLRAEMEAMSSRLAAADAARQRLDELDGKVTGLTTRLDTPIAPPPTDPPPPPPPSVDPAEIDKINAKIQRLSARLDEVPHEPAPSADLADVAHLRAEVDLLSLRLDESVDAGDAQAASDRNELAELRAAVERLAMRLEEVDQRISAISTELANQISELSGDLEAMGSDEPPTERVVDELRDAQTRLANEQARYQIAFRQDLADLADRLKRS